MAIGYISYAVISMAVMGAAHSQGGGMEFVSSEDSGAVRLDGAVKASFAWPVGADGSRPLVDVWDAGHGWSRVRMTWDFGEEVRQDELSVEFNLLFAPDFWWAPHLAPDEGDCVAQHVFRSPALIAAKGGETLVIVPDLDICGANEATPWFVDYDAPARKAWLGMSRTRLSGHVRYCKAEGMVLGPGKVELGFFITVYADEAQPRNPWSKASGFLWERWGRPLFQHGQPTTAPLDAYVDRTYNWAFNLWQDSVWQEFDLDGRRVGAPAFIVNVTQSPNYPGEPNLREFLSIWNQAWFSSLRSASGLMRYARRTDDAGLRDKANLTKELALSAPVKNGLFPSVYRTEMKQVEVGDRKYSRSAGWETGYWTNSNRCPWELGVTADACHVLDASLTCLWMLRWYDDIERDKRLLKYATDYADKLLDLQDAQGFFPAWLRPDTLAPYDVLRDSPETSASATFLLELARLTGKAKYKKGALRALDAVLAEIVPGGRWEDFETYWSCCDWGKEEFLGRRIPRNAMYKQNTLSMFWTAEALLYAYRATREERYLSWGRRTLDELSMAQQCWQPPFIHVPALGGFGVMNFDGEWNDSRQSLFAELFLEYYRETGEANLSERGIAALKASFVMMYCPENPQVKALWEMKWDFFGPEDYGFMMENYGHGGAVDKRGGGMGEFTIYDWGNGAAAEARNRIRDHFGDVYIDRKRNQGFGIDGVAVKPYEGGYFLQDTAGRPREIRIVFEDGTAKKLFLEGTHEI